MKKNEVIAHLRDIAQLPSEVLCVSTGITQKNLYSIEYEDAVIPFDVIQYYAEFFNVKINFMQALFCEYDRKPSIQRFFQNAMLSILLAYFNIGKKLSTHEKRK